ncbi:MAG: hypothetical protein LCH54_17380 [Bacteroidetes bacterium]|nr:hypothetical protein [Bacteroidota bacterium]
MEKIINVGPLKSFGSLTFYLGSQLDELRESYIKGERLVPVWDLRNISPYGVSMSALTAFLSISKRIRDFIGQPIKVLIHWQPDFQEFLADIGFLHIANEFDLYDWQDMLGGYNTGSTNPKTKIFFYSNLPDIDKSDIEEVILWKDTKRQEIKHSIKFRLSNLFESKYFKERWSKNLESILTITAAELVVNSLLHGNDIAFVGVQRSRTGITTVICDSGIGFPKSMMFNNKNAKHFKNITHFQALVLASLQSKNKIGLYRAIDDVISTNGYVIMSSFNTEIRWENKFWTLAKNIENKFNVLGDDNILGEPITGFVDMGRIVEGYHKIFDKSLVGSRITFEIPFKR